MRAPDASRHRHEIPYPLRMLCEHPMVTHDARSQRHGGLHRQDVEMDMGHLLPPGSFGMQAKHVAVRTEGRACSDRDLLRNLCEISKFARVDVEDVARRLFRDHQAMAVNDRHDVEEGWGLVVLEALAADLPVVASDIAVLREYLTADRTAVLTRAGDPQSLADGMRRIVDDATLRAGLIRHGRELVPAFSWRQTAREHARIYAGAAG